MVNFSFFHGVVRETNPFWIGSNDTSGCYKLMSIQNVDGSVVNFVVSPSTYFVDNVVIADGDIITAYYDADAPVQLIYPLQLRAIVIAKDMENVNVKVDYFDMELVSSDGMLKLDLSLETEVMLTNGQWFYNNPANHNLVVTYGASTKSIPAQTTPYKIVVMCM